MNLAQLKEAILDGRINLGYDTRSYNRARLQGVTALVLAIAEDMGKHSAIFITSSVTAETLLRILNSDTTADDITIEGV